MERKKLVRFTVDDDEIITKYFQMYKNNKHEALEILCAKLGYNHTKKAIEERYRSFLSKNTSPFTKEEDDVIIQSHMRLNNKWSKIAQILNTNRSGDQVKIRFAQLNRSGLRRKAKNKQNKKDETKPEKSMNKSDTSVRRFNQTLELDKSIYDISRLLNH